MNSLWLIFFLIMALAGTTVGLMEGRNFRKIRGPASDVVILQLCVARNLLVAMGTTFFITTPSGESVLNGLVHFGISPLVAFALLFPAGALLLALVTCK